MRSLRTMTWSLRIGRVFGIDLLVHTTFLILLAWIAIEHYLHSGSVVAALVGVLFVLAVFVTVVLHELGHALTARTFGIRTRDITLLPIGGVARLETMPEEPRQELVVAFAGPLVNVIIAGALLLGLLATSTPLLPDLEVLSVGAFVARLFWVNVMLAVFNLIPAFPMDGGRVLRALLAMQGDRTRATQSAARIGQGIAFLLGVVGLFFNPFLIFIALFVWIGAAAESRAVETRSALLGLPVHAGMITRFRALAEDESLRSAARTLVGGSQIDFPVVSTTGHLVGMLTRGSLIESLSRGEAEAPVSRVMDREFETADPNEPLDAVATRLSASGQRAMPVLHEGNVVGLLTMENLAELMLVQGALRRAHDAVPRGFVAAE